MDIYTTLRGLTSRLEAVERRRQPPDPPPRFHAKRSAFIPANTAIAAGGNWGTDISAPTGFTESNCVIQTTLFFAGATGYGVQATTSPQARIYPLPYWWPNAWTLRVGVHCPAAYTFHSGYCRVDVLWVLTG